MICLKNCTFVVSTTTFFKYRWLLCSCDLLEKLYLCGINNNHIQYNYHYAEVVICLKNCTFVVSTTTWALGDWQVPMLWFAWKIVPLWYQQQPSRWRTLACVVVICLKNCTFVVSTTTREEDDTTLILLWFAWKIVPLWYQQQRTCRTMLCKTRCDLLEKLYLCGINNNVYLLNLCLLSVVICLKNCTFVVSTTTP